MPYPIVMPTPKPTFDGIAGLPLVGGKLYTYAAGTTVPKPTYISADGAVEQPNPIPLNARGEPRQPIFWDGSYYIELRDALGSLIYTVDNFQTPVDSNRLSSFEGAGIVGINPGISYPDGSIGAYLAQFSSFTGSSLIGYIQSGVGAVLRTLQDKLRDEVWVNDFGAKGGGVDDTDAFNACFAYASMNNKTVRAADGFYTVGNLLYGSQSTTAQSQSPSGFVGSSRNGCILIAKPGTTGTIFQGWSLAGTRLENFGIYTSGTAAKALDLDWKPGVGPSTQNEIRRIRVLGGTAPVHVSLIDLNDTYPSELSVIASAPTQCCIDARQSGGLLIMDRCIWDGGFMRVSAQNMDLRGCWGFGIELSASGVNNIGISGGYLYPNEARGQNIWSESFSSFNSTHSLTIGPGTQIITSANNGFNGVFDLNAYSSIEIIGVEFVSLGGLARMWGPNCRRDSFTNVSVNFVGGSFDNRIEINEPGAFDIQYRNFINKATGYAYKNSYKNYYATGGNAANFAAGNWYEFIPEGTMVEGVYVVWFKWDHKGAGNPFILNAVATITVPQITIGIAGNGADIPTVVGEFRTGLQSVVKFRLASSANPVSPRVEFNSSIPLPDPGVLTWTLTKIS